MIATPSTLTTSSGDSDSMSPMDLNSKDTVSSEKRASGLVCKRCGARIDPATGKCIDKSCGLTQRPDILPADKTSQSKTTRFSSTGRPGAKYQRAIESPIVAPQYICPHCGINVSAARGHCPNQRGCGYRGDMMPKGMQQLIASTEPKVMITASTPVSYPQTAKDFLNGIKHESATIEHCTPTTRSPILGEIDRNEINGRGFPRREKHEKQPKAKGYSETRECHFPSMEKVRKIVLASLLLLAVAASLAFVVIKFVIPAAKQLTVSTPSP